MIKINTYDGNKKNVEFKTGTKIIIGDELGLCGVEEVFFHEDIVCFPQKYMKEVESIVLPDSVKVIGPKTFEHCENLKSVIFSNNIKKIQLSAFLNCSSLKSITLPKSIEVIETWAFGNYELDDIYYEGTIIDFDKVKTEGAFKSIKKLHCSDCVVDFTQKKHFIDKLHFDGTMKNWNDNMKNHWLNRRTSRIICTDGEINNISNT